MERQLDPSAVQVASAPAASAPTSEGRVVGALNPNIWLRGQISEDLLAAFYEQLEAAPRDQMLVVEVFTRGGDADIGRLIASEIKLQQEYFKRGVVFKGRSTVYSAGITIMSAFPRHARYLSRDASLMIHGRQMEKTLNLSGSIRASMPEVKSLLAQMQTALRLEKQDFEDLAAGSSLSADEIWDRSEHNWYLTAGEALDVRLVEGLF